MLLDADTRVLGLGVAAAGAHPFAAVLGELKAAGRFAPWCARLGVVAETQRVCGLHVHVAVGGADATIAAHDTRGAPAPRKWFGGPGSGNSWRTSAP